MFHLSSLSNIEIRKPGPLRINYIQYFGGLVVEQPSVTLAVHFLLFEQSPSFEHSPSHSPVLPRPPITFFQLTSAEYFCPSETCAV